MTMNPEAVEWLEVLDDKARYDYFRPAYPFDGKLYSLKWDHDSLIQCCSQCRYGQDLLVIE